MIGEIKRLKTLKDIIVKKERFIGPLTPADFKKYNAALGEPKFVTKIDEELDINDLRFSAREWVKELEGTNLMDTSCDFCMEDGNRFIYDSNGVPIIMDKNETDIVIRVLKYFFNLEDEE